MKFFAFLTLFVIVAPLSAQESSVESNKQLRASIQKWLGIMRETQSTQVEGKREKEIQLASLAALAAEQKALEEDIKAAREREKELDQESQGKNEKKKAYDAGREALRQGLNDLDQKVSAVIPLLPKVLTSKKNVDKAISDHKGFVLEKDKTKLDLNPRLTAMITILIEAEKFNQLVTYFDARTVDVDGDKKILDGIYFGLAMGFAADPDGTVAVKLTPGVDGWVESRITDSETALKVRELIDVGRAKGDIGLVNLPFEIAK